MRIVVYTNPKCQPCKATKRKMTQLGIPFVEAPASESTEYIRSLGYLSAPVIEVDCGDGATAHWSGYRPDLISSLSDSVVGGVVPVPALA